MASRAQPQAPSGPAGTAVPQRQVRHYRADATILLFGVPIFRRAGVGGGQAWIEESAAGGALRRTYLFAAGSDPKRAHGLNRAGWIREDVQVPRQRPRKWPTSA
jgi:hypothetical protein